MSKTVQVQAEDLETLLFATGAIKDIENALNQRARDTFYLRVESRITQAHNALATEWRRATREPHPEWNQPISDSDVCLIRELWPAVEDPTLDVRFFPKEVPNDPGFMPRIRSLRNKGMIEVGNKQEVIFWGDRASENIGAVKLVVNLTPRGRIAFSEAESGAIVEVKK